MTEADKLLRAEIATASMHGYSFYVYALADARGRFYVDKGKGSRLFQHGRHRDDRNRGKLELATSSRRPTA